MPTLAYSTEGKHVAQLLVAGAALVGCFICLMARPGAQQATFTNTIDLVTLNVSVLDKNREPVRGLTAKDFVVIDGGEERPVVAVSMIEVPRVRAAGPVWTDTAVLDVVTNAPKNGRLVVLYLDIVKGASPWRADRIRRIAANAIAALGPDDMAAIVYSMPMGTPINFTSDRARLLAAVQSWSLIVPPGTGDPCLLRSLEGLLLIGQILEPVREVPKMVIYIGEDTLGVDVPPTSDCAPYSIPLAHEMFRALQLAQIPVHAVNPMGVETSGFTADQRFSSAGRGPNYNPLRILAENTGGRVVVGTNSPQEAVPAIFAESDVQYLVGFTPRTKPSRDPVQRVTVRVRRDDAIVLAPSGYRRAYERVPSTVPPDPVKAAAAAAVSANVRAVSNLKPVPDIVMRAAVSAVPDPADRERALVATVVGIDLPVSGAASVTAEVEVSAYDADGRQQGIDKHAVTLTPMPGASVLTPDVLSRLSLRPGTYEVRASVVTGDGKVGSIYTHVTVDNFGKGPLAVSGLLLHATAAPRLVTPADPVSWLPVAPTTTRAFTPKDYVTAAIRLFQPRELSSKPVTIETAVTDAKGQRVATIPAQLATQAFSPARVADYRIDLPLATLAPGDYLLSITVTLDKTKITRTARFSVR